MKFLFIYRIHLLVFVLSLSLSVCLFHSFHPHPQSLIPWFNFPSESDGFWDFISYFFFGFEKAVSIWSLLNEFECLQKKYFNFTLRCCCFCFLSSRTLVFCFCCFPSRYKVQNLLFHSIDFVSLAPKIPRFVCVVSKYFISFRTSSANWLSGGDQSVDVCDCVCLEYACILCLYASWSFDSQPELTKRLIL